MISSMSMIETEGGCPCQPPSCLCTTSRDTTVPRDKRSGRAERLHRVLAAWYGRGSHPFGCQNHRLHSGLFGLKTVDRCRRDFSGIDRVSALSGKRGSQSPVVEERLGKMLDQ